MGIAFMSFMGIKLDANNKIDNSLELYEDSSKEVNIDNNNINQKEENLQ